MIGCLAALTPCEVNACCARSTCEAMAARPDVRAPGGGAFANCARPLMLVSIPSNNVVSARPVPPGNVVSVSYTHLRAHETRHDLVCRLLLEKKKKQTKA